MRELTRNLLLDCLPEGVRHSILQHCEPVKLPVRAPIFQEEKTPRHIHFLTSGIASILTTMQSGEAVEVGIVGHEGFPEKTHILGPQHATTRCFMQVAGTAYRMDYQDFLSIFLHTPELLRTVHQYIQHDTFVLGQLGACNRLHEVEARLARWLLMVYDRVGTNEVPLTQEFLGEMLGARRSSVNLAATSLQRSGVITHRRGHIVIADPKGLEGVACECYPIIAKLFRNLYC